MKQIFDSLKKQSPSRIIALGFSAVILVGAVLLMMPFSLKKGVHLSFLNALFTSTSAVCVTGLVVVDTADSFTAIGQAIVAALIQIGGLGIASVGVGFIIAAGKRVSIKSRLMVKEALNVDTYHGMVRLVRIVLAITLGFEAAGAIISFFVFRKDYSPLHAVGISIFHSIAAFNNAGFDNLGGMHNLIPYKDNILLNITTDVLVIVGGIGFLVLVDIVKQKSFKKLCLHSKVAISMTAVLLIGGTLILKGRKVKKGVRCIVIPATQQIYLQAMREGLLEIFIEAGAVVSTPTCGPCLGGYMGILAEGERCISTTNRNFVGRMGHVKSEVYLASPAVAAASAVTGKISAPAELGL